MMRIVGARFEREARLLASLNHPHIAAVYGFEHGGSIWGLVLELVEGETLADRLRRGPLDPDETLTIARQVADALAAAHDKGIIHRDLKPGNISITRDGAAKVLDFGLAKISDTRGGPLGSDAGTPGLNALDRSPTVTVGGTREGIILGTAAYMSPEQARGKAVDRRTDVWAFGCVLYEMLTGAMAFPGETVSDTIAAILGREPAWDRLPSSTPSPVRRLLRRCLAKDPKRRLHDIVDARIEIDEAVESPSADEKTERSSLTRRSHPVVWAIAGVLAGTVIAVLAFQRLARPPSDPVTRFTIDLPPQVDIDEPMALSPDGRTIIYSGADRTGRRLYRRTLDSLDSVTIRGTDGATAPFISPDGTSVGFVVGRTLRTVPLQGGAPVTLVDTAGGGGPATWLSDGTIVFATEGRGLRRIPATGGTAEELTVIDRANSELEHRWPTAGPGNHSVLFVVHYGGRDSQQVHAVTLSDRHRRSIVQGNGVRLLPTGQLLFQRSGSLWVAPFDQQELKLTGPPTPVLENVDIDLDWAPLIGVSANGSLAYATGGTEPYPPRTLVWVDRTGKEQVIDAPPRSWWWPQISPDGKRLGFHIMDPVNMDAWIYELPQGPLIRVTYHPFQDGYPLWTPDGKDVVFWSPQGGSVAALYLRSADLTGSDRRLTADSSSFQVPLAFAEGGKLLVYQETGRETGIDISIVPMTANGSLDRSWPDLPTRRTPRSRPMDDGLRINRTRPGNRKSMCNRFQILAAAGKSRRKAVCRPSGAATAASSSIAAAAR